MEAIDLLEDSKRKMINSVISNTQIPDNILKIVKDGFLKLQELYNRCGCNNSEIQEYIYGKINETCEYIKSYVEKGRRIEQAEILKHAFDTIEKRLMEKHIKPDERDAVEIKLDNVSKTKKITDIMIDMMKNIQSRQNRLLDARGYSSERILQIQDSANQCMRDYIKNNEEKIYNALQQDDKDLESFFKSQYIQIANFMTPKTKREEFIEQINVKGNLDLKAQNENAKKIEEKNQDKRTANKVLPDNIID